MRSSVRTAPSRERSTGRHRWNEASTRTASQTQRPGVEQDHRDRRPRLRRIAALAARRSWTLFYIAPDNSLTAVPVRGSSDGRTFNPGAPVMLFRTQVATNWPALLPR